MYELTHAPRTLPEGFKTASLSTLGALEERQFFDLLARAFGTADFPTYTEDFPIWGSPRQDTVRLVAIKSGIVYATLGVRITELKPTRIQVALIGAVATRPEARGQGLAGALLDDAIRLVEKAGIKTTLLWGEPSRLYQDRGFAPSGEQHLLGLRNALVGVPPSPSFESDFTPLAMPLMQSRPTGIVRTFADAHWLSLQKNTKWATQVDAGGTPIAFVAWNRGVDLGGVVHEWGGHPNLVKKLLVSVTQENPELLIVAREEELKILGIDLKLSVHTMPVALVRGPVPENLWIWGLDGV